MASYTDQHRGLQEGLPMKRLAILALVLTAILPCLANSQSIITTVAGTNFTFPPNATVALNAPLGPSYGVAADLQGNIYVADAGNGRIFKVGPDGSIRIVAGNGITGYSGDGGPATAASLNTPLGVAVDASGNLFIADSYNSLIRKVSASGIITTVAGAAGGSTSLGDGGPATSAFLGAPYSVAVDASGNLFIADSFDNRIRKVAAGTGIITTVAGNGTAGYSGDNGPATAASLNLYSPGVPAGGIAVDTSGNLFIADSFNSRVRKVSAAAGAGGIITTVAGDGRLLSSGDGGQAISASLVRPFNVAVDAAGNLFISDLVGDRIRKVSTGGIITTVAGNGVGGFSGDSGLATSAQLSFPAGVAVDVSGSLFIADSFNARIRKVGAGAGATITTYVGNGNFSFSGDGGPATSAAMFSPYAVTLDAAGNFYIADQFSNRIRKVSAAGTITTVAGTGSAGFSGDGGLATAASLYTPYGMAVDTSGNLFIADTDNNRIRKVSAAGIITTFAGCGTGNGCLGFAGDGGPAASAAFAFPYGVAADASGNIFIADTLNNRIRKVASNGIVTTVAGGASAGFSGDGGSATSALLNRPQAVAVDASGNLFIVDSNNNRIRKVAAGTTGTITTVAGNGTAGSSGDGGPATAASLNGIAAIAVDASGNLYIADATNNRVRRVTAAGGIITTVAGTGTAGFSGDGGPATSASLNNPDGVAIDAFGNLFIADTFNSRIRLVPAVAPAVMVSPAQFSFSFDAPNGQINLTSPVPGIGWSATSSSTAITLTPSSGITPSVISVTSDIASLPKSGTFSASIIITNPLASPQQETINVSLNTNPNAGKPSLAVAPMVLNFQIQQGAPAQSQTVAIGNVVGGALPWTAQGDAANPWISFSPSSSTSISDAFTSTQVTVSSAGLSVGVHTGMITVTSPATSDIRTVTVNLLVTPAAPTILLSETALTFVGIESGGIVPAQNFAVLNSGGGSMNWTATVGSPTPWLTLSSSTGTSIANSIPPAAQVNVDATGMLAGTYVGQIQVLASGATNTPQVVTVLLKVLPKGSPLPPVVQPTSLIFVRQAGTSSPGSQTVLVSTAKPETASATASVAAKSPFAVTLLPANFSFSPSQPAQFVVQPALGSLAPGQYSTTITIQSTDSSGASNQVVTVLFVVTAGPTSSSQPGGAVRAEIRQGPADITCTASNLTVAVQTINGASVGAAQKIQAKVIDDCNILRDGANVTATFQYIDSPLTLASIGNGIYETSWSPLKAGSQNVTVAAVSGSLKGQANATVVGTVTGQTQIFTTFTNAASFTANGALSPGSLISVFGQNLSGSTASASFPIPTLLGGAQLNIGGQNVPLLYTSPTQVNAQVPLSISPNSGTAAYFVVNSGSFLVGQQSIVGQQNLLMARASPGIFATDDAHLTGQGAITDAKGVILNNSNPASRGQVVIIYATGLGTVDKPPVLGAPAPASPPANTIDVPSVSIGGLPSVVQFSGLAPGFVGLYQINVVVPNVAPGASVPVVITQSGFTSNSVTMVVR